VGKSKVVYVMFLRDVACQKLLTSALVSRSYSQNNTGTVFFETRCISIWLSKRQGIMCKHYILIKAWVAMT